MTVRDAPERRPVVSRRAFEALLMVRADPRNLEDRVAAMISGGTSRYAADLLLRPAIELDSGAWWRLLSAYTPDLRIVDAIVEEMTGTAISEGSSQVNSSGGVGEGGRCGV